MLLVARKSFCSRFNTDRGRQVARKASKRGAQSIRSQNAAVPRARQLRLSFQLDVRKRRKLTKARFARSACSRASYRVAPDRRQEATGWWTWQQAAKWRPRYETNDFLTESWLCKLRVIRLVYAWDRFVYIWISFERRGSSSMKLIGTRTLSTIGTLVRSSSKLGLLL